MGVRIRGCLCADVCGYDCVCVVVWVGGCVVACVWVYRSENARASLCGCVGV